MLTYADGAASSRILDEDVEEEVEASGIGGVSAMSVVLDSRHSLTSAIVCLDLLANTAIANHQVRLWSSVWPHVSACSSVCVAACLRMLLCVCGRISPHAPLYVCPHVCLDLLANTAVANHQVLLPSYCVSALRLRILVCMYASPHTYRPVCGDA